MTGMSKALPAGLPDRVQLLLAEPPAMEKMLIELSVTWPGLTGGLARISDAVRLFVITWDPLEGMLDRSAGFATTNGGRADLEIVVYLPTWSLVRLAAERDSSVATVMGAMAGSAFRVRAAHSVPRTSTRYRLRRLCRTGRGRSRRRGARGDRGQPGPLAGRPLDACVRR